MRWTRMSWAAGLLALWGCAGMDGARAAQFQEFPIKRPAKVLSVKDFGAAGDGVTMDTAAIAKAIAAGAKAGGAVISFPPGSYATGAIRLESNITLDLATGATLAFSTDPRDYPLVKTRWEGTECMNYSPLIYADECENIAITGEGTIDGRGARWWAWSNANGDKALAKLRSDGAAGTPVAQRVFGDRMPGLRPPLIEAMSCQNVLLEGVTIRQSPFWTVHPVYCENVVVRRVTIEGTGPNTDGVDVDSCKNVLIERSTIDTGDDCVAIKSGRDADGRRVGLPADNVTVRYCTMRDGHAGVAIGSETSGGVRNVLVTDCTFSGTSFGVRLKTQRGRGGVVENVVYKNLAIDRVPQDAISINMQYENPPVEKESARTPVFRNITVEDVTATDCGKAATVMGLSESPIEGLVLKNLKLWAKEGINVTHADGVVVKDVKVNGKEGGEVFVDCRDVVLEGAKRDYRAVAAGK